MMLGWFGVNVGVAGVALARLAGIPDRRRGDPVRRRHARRRRAWGWRCCRGRRWSPGSRPRRWPPTACTSPSPTTTPRSRAVTPASRPDRASCPRRRAGDRLRRGVLAAHPDFTHDLARPRQVVWCALVGLAVAGAGRSPLAGAALQAATGNWDLADVLRGLGARASPTCSSPWASPAPCSPTSGPAALSLQRRGAPGVAPRGAADRRRRGRRRARGRRIRTT